MSVSRVKVKWDIKARKIYPSVFCFAKSSSPFKGAKVNSGMSATRVEDISGIKVKKIKPSLLPQRSLSPQKEKPQMHQT